MIKGKRIYRVKRVIQVETWADIAAENREEALDLHDLDCKFSPECLVLNGSDHDVSIDWRTIGTEVELLKLVWNENEDEQ